MSDRIVQYLDVKPVDPALVDSPLPFKRPVKVDEEKKALMEKDFKTLYEQWDEGSSLLRSKLQRFLMNSEGISDNTKEVWPGSSKIVKPIIETRQNIIHAYFMGILRNRVGRLFSALPENPGSTNQKDLANRVAAYFNSHRKFNYMFVTKASDAFWGLLRDGTVGVSAAFARKIERKWRVKRYDTIDDFKADFSAVLGSGMDEKTFMGVIQQLTAGQSVDLEQDYYASTWDAPEVDVQEFKDVVFIPVNASSAAMTIFLGNKFKLTKSQVKTMAEISGIFNPEWTKKVLEKDPEADEDSVSQYQGDIEGLSQPNDRSVYYTFVQGRYFADLDGDGIDEKYLVTYSLDGEVFVQFDKYPFFHGRDYLKLAQFKKRPNRIAGRGVSEMLEDLHVEATVRSRQRIDAASITNVPMFKANDLLKDILDMRRLENQFRPGGFWYVPKSMIDDIKPVDVAKREFGDMMNEENVINLNADNIVGASELRSGRETPNDPRSPAAKTAMLLNQSTVRLDDFVIQFIFVLNEVLQDCLELVAQYGPETIKFFADLIETAEGKATGPSNAKLTRKELLEGGVTLQLSFTSLIENPEFLRGRWEDFYLKFGPDPMLSIPESHWQILNNVVQNMPEAVGKPLLLPLETILQKMPQAAPAMPGGSPAPAGGAVNPTLAAAMSGLKPGVQ